MPSLREYPATIVGGLLAILLIGYTLLTARTLLDATVVAVPLLGLAVVVDVVQIDWRSPREYQATILTVALAIVSGTYVLLTPTNVLLWFVPASLLIGVAMLIDGFVLGAD